VMNLVADEIENVVSGVHVNRLAVGGSWLVVRGWWFVVGGSWSVLLVTGS
jgi:hypothetical protein